MQQKHSLPILNYSDTAKWFQPETETAWLALREKHITATASPALFGVSPYMTAFDLYHRLAGNVSVVVQESDRIKWGKRLQQAIATGICEDNGWEIVVSHPYLYAESLSHPGIGCSPDYLIRDRQNPDKGLGCLEIKNVDLFVGLDDWNEGEAPPHIEIQLQHQIGVCGLSWGVIGGLIGGNRPHVFVRDADREVIGAIFEAGTSMLDRVKRGDPPAPDYLADYETIRTLYRHADPARSLNLDIPEDETAADHLEALIAAKHRADIAAKLADDDRKRASAELLDALKYTETVFGRGWKVLAKTTYLEETIITRPATSYRNLRVTRPTRRGKK